MNKNQGAKMHRMLAKYLGRLIVAIAAVTLVVATNSVSTVALAQGNKPERAGTPVNIHNEASVSDVTGFTRIKYNPRDSSGQLADSVGVSICKTECIYTNRPIRIKPNYQEGELNDGIAYATDDEHFKVFFENTGLHEILVSTRFDGKELTSSLFVNVLESASSIPMPWEEVLPLVSNAADSIGLESTLDCGARSLTFGKPKACAVSVDTILPYGSIPTRGIHLNAVVPVTISTRLNGSVFKPYKHLNLTTTEVQRVSIPVPNSLTAFSIRMSIDGYTSSASVLSQKGKATLEWGPPPAEISVAIPSVVGWGKAFKIGVKSNKTGNGSCQVLLNNTTAVTRFNLSRGQGVGSAKVTWAGAVGSRETLRLFVYCNIGGQNVSGYTYTAGVR